MGVRLRGATQNMEIDAMSCKAIDYVFECVRLQNEWIVSMLAHIADAALSLMSLRWRSRCAIRIG